MQKENAKDSVIKVINEYLGRSDAESHLFLSVPDLGGDSLSTVEIVLELEEVFNIRIDDADMRATYSVQDLIELVETKLKVDSNIKPC